jgi:hypothetical protein
MELPSFRDFGQHQMSSLETIQEDQWRQGTSKSIFFYTIGQEHVGHNWIYLASCPHLICLFTLENPSNILIKSPSTSKKFYTKRTLFLIEGKTFRWGAVVKAHPSHMAWMTSGGKVCSLVCTMLQSMGDLAFGFYPEGVNSK